MKKIWSETAWNDYIYWQKQDKKTLKKINDVIKDIERNKYTGLGSPEPLKGELAGFWSRHIDSKNRLIYNIDEIHETIAIAQCRGHYKDK